jgi:hypothetical protein
MRDKPIVIQPRLAADRPWGRPIDIRDERAGF